MAQNHPAPQYLSPEHVIHEMLEQARDYTQTFSPLRIAILAVLGGSFITLGALLSILLSSGIETRGLQLLQHSPANMGYFSMIMPTGGGPGWATALLWNIIPAGIGNILGAALLVALPLWYALRPKTSS